MPKQNEDTDDSDYLDIKLKALEDRIDGYEKRVTVEAMLYGMEGISARLKEDRLKELEEQKDHVKWLEERIKRLEKRLQDQIDYGNKLVQVHNIEASANNTVMANMESRHLNQSEKIANLESRIVELLEGD